MSTTSPLIRLSPLQPSQLPPHPALESTDSDDTKRPHLLLFVHALLDQANSILHPTAFNMTFTTHSNRSSPPSNTQVESLTYSIPATTISDVNWQDPDQTAGIGRMKPRDVPAEHWVARRSYHANTSSKQNSSTASWPEFVFGLRDNHSKNEAEFTPTIFDARHILDWNSDLEIAAQEHKVDQRHAEQPGSISYTNITLAVYEMCHEIPFPMQPRCFPVLVATASTDDNRFVAVTVPVNLGSYEGAFYSTGRNRTEGETAARKKQVVLGVYTAVESCKLITRKREATTNDIATPAATEEGEEEEEEEVIEWIMATASDAKGNLPMAMQRSAMPGAVAKDVGYFLKWIHTVDDVVIRGEKKQSFDTADNVQANGNRRRSRGGSSAR